MNSTTALRTSRLSVSAFLQSNKCLISFQQRRGKSSVEESRTPTSLNKSFVNATFAPTDFESNSALVYENFITQVEGVALKKDVLARMRRRKFQKGHWDAVITDYKEVELPNHVLSKESGAAMERVRTQIEQTHFSEEEVEWIPSHAIQLRKDSDLKAHVDSVKFSGDIVAGLSLSSASIMRLKPASPSELCEHDDDTTHNGETQSKSLENAGHVDLYLPPLSLYILSGVSRFRYTHELLPSNSCFQCNGDEILVERQGRISIIFRDKKEG